MRTRPFSPTAKRLMPLFAAVFLLNMPFWYATEKLFMTGIGFTAASIGLMVAIMSAVMLLVETPSGILADRWSRKGVVMLAILSLIASCLIGGFSYAVPMYILSTVFWGIHAAMYSGTFDAVIYDVVLEETGNSKSFGYFLSRLRIIEGVALVAGALGGGLIASILGTRQTFFLSLPLMALSMVYLARFREPTLHKAEVSEPILLHTRQTFGAVLNNRALIPVVLSIIGFAILLEGLFEFYQLWFIALGTPVVLYGLFGAIMFSTWTFGGMLSTRINSKQTNSAAALLLLVASTTLIFSRNSWVTLSAQFIAGIVLVAFGVLLLKKLHDNLPSKTRAGSGSVMSTLGRLLLIPGSIVFTAAANNHSIFQASTIIVAVAAITIAAYMVVLWQHALKTSSDI